MNLLILVVDDEPDVEVRGLGREENLIMTDKRKDAAWTSTSRRRFLQSAAWTAGAVATGVGSWIIRPEGTKLKLTSKK